MKEFKFTQPFAMKCDAAQFLTVKNELEGMGYNVIESGKGVYLCTNYANYNFRVGISGICTYQKLPIETFNRDLCLALAAMTDKPDGIAGEWWMCTRGDGIYFKTNNIYKQVDNYKGMPTILSDRNIQIVCIANDCFRKATADELIKYFTENVAIAFGSISKSNPVKTETERLQKQIAELIERVSKLEKQQPEAKSSIRYTIATVADIINCTNESNIDNFLTDFKNVINTAHKAKAKGRKLDNASFDWIDDGKNNSLTYNID